MATALYGRARRTSRRLLGPDCSQQFGGSPGASCNPSIPVAAATPSVGDGGTKQQQQPGQPTVIVVTSTTTRQLSPQQQQQALAAAAAAGAGGTGAAIKLLPAAGASSGIEGSVQLVNAVLITPPAATTAAGSSATGPAPTAANLPTIVVLPPGVVVPTLTPVAQPPAAAGPRGGRIAVSAAGKPSGNANLPRTTLPAASVSDQPQGSAALPPLGDESDDTPDKADEHPLPSAAAGASSSSKRDDKGGSGSGGSGGSGGSVSQPHTKVFVESLGPGNKTELWPALNPPPASPARSGAAVQHSALCLLVWRVCMPAALARVLTYGCCTAACAACGLRAALQQPASFRQE